MNLLSLEFTNGSRGVCSLYSMVEKCADSGLCVNATPGHTGKTVLTNFVDYVAE
jgi:hypothetical protein